VPYPALRARLLADGQVLDGKDLGKKPKASIPAH
jgi:hypothetical protein